MTQTQDKTFLGMTIHGDYDDGGHRKVEQKPKEELAPFFEKVFADKTITGVRWNQNTPYFNDGDPCVFSVNEYSMMVRIPREVSAEQAEEMLNSADIGHEDDFEAGWVECDDFASGYYSDYPFTLLVGKKVYPETPGGIRDRSKSPTYEGPKPELAEAVFELRAALGEGAFDSALLELFGDHAQITVPAEGTIEIETYEHD